MKDDSKAAHHVASTKEQGDRGEEIAITYLKQNHYQILERQWHFHHLELDIVAEDVATSELVIVEVKTRTSGQYGDPVDAVDGKKIRRMVDAADFYIKEHNIELPWRFDIIAIILQSDGKFKLEHIKEAFYPPLR